MTKTEVGLYEALEAALSATQEPMDCVSLFELSSVREHAASINRVSDYLGNLWRKGVLTRLPAPGGRDARSRWMYLWKGRPSPDEPDVSKAVEFKEAPIFDRANVKITTRGSVVTVRLPNMTLTIDTTPNN